MIAELAGKKIAITFTLEGIAGHFHFDYAMGRIRHDLELQIEIYVLFDSMEQLRLEQRLRKLAYHIAKPPKNSMERPPCPTALANLKRSPKH